MGNRSNIYIQDSFADGEGVYIYSHWGGLNHLQNGLDALATPFAQARMSDSAYLTRIVAQHILDIEGKSETGFGISSTMQDNQHDILVIDPKNKMYDLVPEGCEKDRLTDGFPLTSPKYLQIT